MISRQDTATYEGKQQNIGFNADLDLKGTNSSVTVNGGKTDINSDYAAVGEQAIIATQTSDLVVGGKGNFIGSALTTATPEDNKTVFKQGIKTQDIINHSRYEGDSIQAGISIGSTNGKPQGGMNGMGYGTDGDDQTSTTFAGVTGMAGKSEATTGTRDILNEPLVNSFDEQKVTEELNAQTQITKEFGKEAPKAVAEFAKDRIDAIKKDPTLTMDEKLAEIKKWDEGGVYRVAAHTAVGAFGTGSLEGALTTGGVAAAAPVISDLEQKMADKLVEQGMSADIAQSTANAITSVALVGTGTAAGLDVSSAGMAVNVDANNRQLHWSEMAKLNDSAQALSKKYGRDANYWKAILYAVTYSHLDKKGTEKLAWLKKELTGAAHIPASKEFVSIVDKDIAIAEATYKNLSNKYGTTQLAKDTHSSSMQNKPIYMFDESGYYNDNSIYGTYGGSLQGNRNNSKNFYKVAEGLQNQATDIDTRNDRINPLYPEQYYIPLSELKALGTVGIAGAKAVVKKQTEKKAASEVGEKEISHIYGDGDLDNIYRYREQQNFAEIELVDANGSPLGEIDGIDLKNKVFIEDKAAKGLNIINPSTGKPQQTAMQFAEKQIYTKTSKRITALKNATNTRITKNGSSVAPKLEDIKNIKKFVFRLDGDSPELQRAVNKSMANLKRENPEYSFNAIYGVQ